MNRLSDEVCNNRFNPFILSCSGVSYRRDLDDFCMTKWTYDWYVRYVYYCMYQQSSTYRYIGNPIKQNNEGKGYR